MSGFLLWGVIAGAILVAIHIYFSAAAKQPPVLSEAVELIVWAIGVTGGIKVCKYVLTGELSAAFKSTTPIAEEDLVYFLVGGFTLI